MLNLRLFQAVLSYPKRRLNSLPLAVRLLLAFQIIIFLTVSIGAFAANQFSQLTDTSGKLSTHEIPETILLDRIRALLLEQYNVERSFVSNVSTNVDQNQQAVQLTGIVKEIGSNRTALLQLEINHSEDTNDVILMQNLARYTLVSNGLATSIQNFVKTGQRTRAQALEQTQLEPLLQIALTTTRTLLNMGQQEANTVATDIQKSSVSATRMVFVLMMITLIVSILLAMAITRSLTQPISFLLSATETIADGNLDVALDVTRKDEIGRLALAFNQMRINLRSMIERLTQERQRTQAIIDACADGVVLLNEQCQIVQMNPAAEKISGYSAADAQGKTCFEVFHYREMDANAALQKLSTCEGIFQTDARAITMEIQIGAQSQQERWYAVSCTLFPHIIGAQERLFVLSLHDISHLKAVEQVKTDFVSMVSHELRAPLTTVTGSVEMLSGLDAAQEPEIYQEVISILDQQTQRLRQVVEEVLQVTRFEAGRISVQLQALPLGLFLRRVLKRLQEEGIEETHPLVLSLPQKDIWVHADHNLLEIVIRNIIDNARKYTPIGNSIDLVLEVQAGCVQVSISDHGPGIPSEQLPHLFERFFRGSDGMQNSRNGYGLGLYIARQLIEAQQGEIWAENYPGGARFIFSLKEVKKEASAQKESSYLALVGG